MVRCMYVPKIMLGCLKQKRKLRLLVTALKWDPQVTNTHFVMVTPYFTTYRFYFKYDIVALIRQKKH